VWGNEVAARLNELVAGTGAMLVLQRHRHPPLRRRPSPLPP
jgi:hypothetical protein